MTALDDLADIGRSRVFDNLNEIAIIIHNPEYEVHFDYRTIFPLVADIAAHAYDKFPNLLHVVEVYAQNSSLPE